MLHVDIADGCRARLPSGPPGSAAPKGLLIVWTRQVLVVASVTATSRELIDALSEQSERAAVAFTLIVPATPTRGGRAGARRHVDEAVALMRQLGLEVQGTVGDGDPLAAVVDAWDPKRYDEIVISTLPTNMSRWLQADLPRRIERTTGALVTHVVAQPPKREPATTQLPDREKRGVLAPLSTLTWGPGPNG